MMLVAGLAVAGLIGIAAAFYFSIRSGKGGDKRLRSARTGRGGAGRRPESRSGGTARPGRSYQVDDDTGPNPAVGFGDPMLIGARRGAPGTGGRKTSADSRRTDPQATDPRLGAAAPDPRLGSRPVARLSREAHAGRGEAKNDKPRRRVSFRKGAHVDEDLWPTEGFGGVSDEQFWDDLASDKPLTTTARTAQQVPGTRKRPLDAAPYAGKLTPGDNRARDDRGRDDRGRDDRGRDDRGRDDRGRDDRGRDDRGRGEARRVAGAGALPDARTGPNPAAERTAIQPAYAATQPVKSMTAQAQPVQTAVDVSQPPGTGSQRPGTGGRPLGAPPQPTETRKRRRPSSDEEDPLTSARFSLRSSGPVDGRSFLRSQDMTRERDTTMNTPPYGLDYGYGSGGPAAQAGDPPRQNGTRSHARHRGDGEGTRAGRQVYPQDGHQVTGSYQAGQGIGSYPAGAYSTGGYPSAGYPAGGHQGNGYPGHGHRANGHRGNGPRAPYDPRDDYRRLTHQR